MENEKQPNGFALLVPLIAVGIIATVFLFGLRSQQKETAGGITVGNYFRLVGNVVSITNNAIDFAIGNSASPSAMFVVDPGLDRTTLSNLVVTGTCTGCGGAGVSSNSLNFDEFQNPLVADTDITLTGGPYSFTFDHASVSGNLDVTGTIKQNDVGLVPYTGATATLDMNANNISNVGELTLGTLTIGTVVIDGTDIDMGGGSLNNVLYLVPNTGTFVNLQDPSSAINAILNTGSLTTSNKTFTFPNQSGTLMVANNFVGNASLSGNFEISGTASISNTLWTTSGNVGIGTTSPGEILSINGTTGISNTASGISGSSSGVGIVNFQSWDGAYNAAGDRLGFFGVGGYTPSDTKRMTGAIIGYAESTWTSSNFPTYLTFETSATNARTEKMRILGNGNVGIGTTAPGYNLAVNGTASVSSGFFGSGLTDCDNATTSKLLWSDTGVFSCGTDAGAGNYLLLTGGTLTGDLFGTNASFSGVFEMGTGFRVSGSIANGLTSLTSTANFFTTASISSKLEVGTGDQFTVLGASGNTTIGGTLGVTGLASFVNASVSGNFEMVAGSTIQGAGLADCSTSTKVLRWSSTTRLFSCGTLADGDIPNDITITTTSNLTGTNASMSGSFEVSGYASASAYYGEQVLWSAAIASTSNEFNTSGRIPLPGKGNKHYIITQIHCGVDTGTSVTIGVSNMTGTYDTETLVCTLAGASDTSIGTNPSYTGFTKASSSLEITGISGDVDFLNFTIMGKLMP